MANRIEVTLFLTKTAIIEHGLPNLETLSRMGATFGNTPSGWQYATITCQSLEDHCLGDWEKVCQWGGWIHSVEYGKGESFPFDIRKEIRDWQDN